MTVTTWAQPSPVDDLDMVFGARAVRDLMPPMTEIPEEFHVWRGNKWVDLQSEWFSNGIKLSQITPKDGVDFAAAMRHLKAIQSSWEPKHEHKMAAVAYLASLWFDDFTPAARA